MANQKWWTMFRRLWSSREGPKEALRSYQPPTLTRLESQDPLVVKSGLLSSSQLSLVEPIHLYWASFRSPLEEFIGVVICRGKSPGSAANEVIKAGIVEAERAQIVMIPAEREAEFEQFRDRLLSENEASELLKKLDISAIRS